MKRYKLPNCCLPFAFLIVLTFHSCKKLVDISPPPNVVTTDKVFDTDASATAATLGDYTTLSAFDTNFIPYAGQYVDELSQPTLNITSTDFANSSITVTNGAVASVWQDLYVTIYKANANIAGLASSKTLSDSVKNQCTGEALFIRAYCNFNLVNLFGDVPLITTTNVSSTSTASRTPAATVYNQIIRPNKLAAVALLARVNLYQQNWAQSESNATAVISSGQYPLSSLTTVFYRNSSEAIWQLWNTNGFTSLSASLVPSASGKPSYTISSNLLGAFENGDQRQANWTKSLVVSGTTYVSPFKYKLKVVTTGTNAEYTMYLRSAEQYLIRAEARAQQNTNLTGAIADLNIIRTRAGLPNLPATLSQQQVLAAVAQERRIELFGEGGHRFFDLKRTGTLNQVMSLVKTSWNAGRNSFYPIPEAQRTINSSLTQNPGYN